MELPLYVLQEELQKNFTLSGQFSRPGHMCHTLRLYGAGTALKEHVLYAVLEGQLDLFQAEAQKQEAGTYYPYVVFSDCLRADVPVQEVVCVSGRNGWQDGFNFLMEFMENLERWDGMLKQLSDRKADYHEYFRISFPIIGNPLILYDHNFIIIADSRGLHPMPDDTDWKNLTAAGYWIPEVRTTAIRDMGDYHFPPNQATYYDSNSFFHNFVIMNLRNGDNPSTFLGTICVHEIFQPITPGGLFLINYMGLSLIERMDQEVAAARKTKDAIDRFLISALQGEHFSSAYIRQRLQMIGWEEDCEYRVIMFSEKHDFMSGTYFPKRMQHIFQNCRSVVIDNYLISVVCLKAGLKLQDFTEFVTIMRDSILKCGISSSIYTFSEIGFGYQQAMMALRIGNSIKPTIWMYRFEDYAVQLFLLEAMNQHSYKMICHPAVLKLDEEDRLTGNCYINTLEAYLTSEKNVGKIAEKLFIHRNTLMYRLDKIVTLTGLDYDNLAEMEYVLLSIYVLRLVRKGHSGMPSFLPATRQWESFEERKD